MKDTGIVYSVYDSVHAVEKQKCKEVQAGLELDTDLFGKIQFPQRHFLMFLHLSASFQKSPEFRCISSGNDDVLTTLHGGVDPVGRQALQGTYSVNIDDHGLAASEKTVIGNLCHK